MKKIFSLITGSLINDIGKVVDNLHTSEEERLEAKQKLSELIKQADEKAQNEVTARWEYDTKNGNFLTRSIRPLVLIFLTAMFTLLAFTDGNIGGFKVQEEYIPIFQTLLVTVYGAYFVGRTYEKSKKN
tara:strand:- start:1470 stop:1856 length:387 start_codon:yes stop_codon:yes gene_type:complete